MKNIDFNELKEMRVNSVIFLISTASRFVYKVALLLFSVELRLLLKVLGINNVERQESSLQILNKFVFVTINNFLQKFISLALKISVFYCHPYSLVALNNSTYSLKS